MLLFSRNESETMSPSNIRMMSRFCEHVLRRRRRRYVAGGAAMLSSTISYLVNGGAGAAVRAEEAHHRAARPQHADDLARQRLGRRLRQEIEDVPAQDAVDAAVRVPEAGVERRASVVERAGARMPVEVGEQVLDEQLAAELLAEERDVGADDRAEVDEHRRLGCCAIAARNFGSAFDGTTGIVAARDRTRSPDASGWPGRFPPQRRRSDSMEYRTIRTGRPAGRIGRRRTPARDRAECDVLSRPAPAAAAAPAACRLRRGAWLRLLLGLVTLLAGLGAARFCMSMLPRKCAPSAIATRGAAMSPSTDPLSRMSTFSVAVTLPVTSPRMMTDLANTCALILPFGADRQHVLAQLDLALDLPFDGQILAAVELALDDDGFADVHSILSCPR